MRHSISLLVIIVSSVLMSITAQAADSESQPTISRFMMGPVAIGYDEHLKVCMTDTSGFLGGANKSTLQENNDIATKIEIYDSTDTTRPLLDVDGQDFLIWQRGFGVCMNIEGRDIGRDGVPRSIIAVLIAVTDGGGVFNPLVTGQLIAPNNTSSAVLLLPAVQGVRE